MFAASGLGNAARGGSGEQSEPRATERPGQASRARPKGYLLWTHAETPEEASAAAAITQELTRTRGETIHLLITTTVNGPLIPSVAAAAIHQLAPGETSGSVTRFLEHWRPDVGLVLGIPDRPNLIHAARASGMPLYLASPARGTLVGRRRLSYLASSLLGQFDICLAASAADAEVLHRHLDDGIKVEVTGPLTDTTFALPCSETERDATALILKGRPVWLAVDVSAAEIDAIEAAHRRAFRFAHRLLLVIIPNDASQASMFEETLAGKGWEVGLSSRGVEATGSIQVLIADSGDEHGLWFRLAPITFVGGTLDSASVPSDPYAPAALGSAVLHGPHTGHAPYRFQRLAKAQASIEIDGPEKLGTAVQTLLAPDKAAVMAQAGWLVTTESAHVVERIAELINGVFDAREAV